MRSVGGSFRDPDSRVFSIDGRIVRGLSDPAHQGLEDARRSGLMEHAPVLGWHDEDPIPDWPHAIAPDPISFLSQPSEWSFAMLRKAALAMLDIVQHAAANNYSVVDATAHNLTFRGTDLVFFDHGSFRAEPFRRWDAYGQFCDEFLAPLLLEAHGGVHFQPYLRGRLHGLPITELAPLLKGTSRFKSGVMSHVLLRARLERRARSFTADERRALSNDAAPGPAVVSRIAGKLHDLISGLESSADSTWAEYTSTCTYAGEETDAKTEFVRSAIGTRGRSGWAWDVGANTGHFSQLLAGHFDGVIALEQDPGAVDRMVDDLGSQPTIHPIVSDVTDPVAGRGVMLEERLDLRGRAPAELAVFLAVAHHLSIGAGLPLWKLAELARWVAPEIVIEFVAPDDAMVAELVASRPLAARGYDLAHFVAAFSPHFETVSRADLTPTRSIYHMVARDK